MDGFSIETIVTILLALVLLATIGFFVIDILLAFVDEPMYTGFHNYIAEATGWELT